MSDKELEQINRWIDNRFGVPNQFNLQLLPDFLEFAKQELGYHKLPTEGAPEYEELREKIRDSVWDALQKWGAPPDAHYTEMIAGDVADKILSLLKGGK